MNVLIAGDFVPKLEVEDKIRNDNWEDVLAGVRSTLSKSDLSIVNLECPIFDDIGTPISKVGPNVKCSRTVAKMLRHAGFKLVTLANNHFLDYGESAAITTMEVLKECGLDYVGGGINLEDASKVFYYKKDKETLAIINCCENEFSIATENAAGSNPLNPISQWYAIREASQKADYILVIVHGGHEMYQFPSPRMQKLYRFFIDAGVDVVVNHHQHCYSGYEVYRGKPIFYGLGNFCFPNYKNRDTIWNEGYMVDISFPSMEFRMIPYRQTSGGENVKILGQNDEKDFFENIERINRIISNENLLQKEFDNLVISKQKSVLSNFVPPLMQLFPHFVSNNLIFKTFWFKKRMLKCLNNIQCESHRDIMLQVINKYLEKL